VPTPAAAGEVPELAVDHRRVDDQPGLQPLVVRLAGEQAGLDVVAAEVDQPDAGRPHPVDQGGEVAVTLGDRLVQRHRHAPLVQPPPELVGDAPAERGPVVDDRDLLGQALVDHVVRGDAALRVVAAADAEDVLEALFGEPRVGRSGVDHQHAALVVDPRGRDRGARAEVAGDEDDPLPGQLLGDPHGLLGVAGVVGDQEPEALAVDAAPLVDVADRHLGAAGHLLAEGGVLLGHGGDAHRAGDGDRDLGPRGEGRNRRRERGGEEDGPDPHGAAP
jgi:hypothetical protein